jgi:ABC-type Mn2+/Zn2+ transport system ATPase subunit
MKAEDRLKKALKSGDGLSIGNVIDGYEPLMSGCGDRGVPEWLQSMFLYECQWLLPVQLTPDGRAEVLDEVQLVPQSGQLPGTLSSGQRRRLALATAFVRPRKLLIMDEPEQRLDVEGVAWLSQRLQAERKSGLAIVFASHEPSLVESVATRVVRLGDAS